MDEITADKAAIREIGGIEGRSLCGFSLLG